jgi:hypothetical protein
MTCFWDSILSSLNQEDFNLLGEKKKTNRIEFIKILKNKNKLTNALWQNKPLKNQEKKEHFEAIKDYNISGIRNGHLTSICDSFLLLICDLLKINIEHRFLNTTIIYSISNSRKTVRFKSNKGHFSRT